MSNKPDRKEKSEKPEKPELVDEEGPITTRAELKQVEERVAIGANIVYEAIRREGDDELHRRAQALAWSGLAAGLSMGFSFVAEALPMAHLPNHPWRPLISRAGYSLGFLIVVLGRQQLFTENTLHGHSFSPHPERCRDARARRKTVGHSAVNESPGNLLFRVDHWTYRHRHAGRTTSRAV